MTTFVLVPGAGGNGSFWLPLVNELATRGYEAVAVDIREDDEALGLPEYAEVVMQAIGERSDVVLVGQSLGAFTVPMVAERVRPRAIVLINAMVPLPGETPGDWWEHTGSSAARIAAAEQHGYPAAFDVETYFLHDLSSEARDVLMSEAPREPADTPFGQPCEFTSWPDVPIHVIIGADDRFFPAQFQTRVAKERLDLEPDSVPGGHLAAVSNPTAVADLLVSYL